MVTLSGFEVPPNKNLTYHYAGQAGPPDDGDEDPAQADNDETGNWRRRLFVWTHLGEWCSEACYNANSGKFRRRGYDGRLALVRALERLKDRDAREKVRGSFLDAISGLYPSGGDRLAA